MLEGVSLAELRAKAVGQLRLSLGERRFLGKAFLAGLVVGLLVAFLIPATLRVHGAADASGQPVDYRNGDAGGADGQVREQQSGGLAGDLLGVKSSGALFIGVLSSRTVQDRIVQRFQLKKVYSVRLRRRRAKKACRNGRAFPKTARAESFDHRRGPRSKARGGHRPSLC